MQWPLIKDELTLTRDLHMISANWGISVLTSTATALDARLVTDEIVVSYAEVKHAAELRKQKAAAQKTTDTLGTRTDKTKTARGHAGPRPGRGGRGKLGFGLVPHFRYVDTRVFIRSLHWKKNKNKSA